MKARDATAIGFGVPRLTVVKGITAKAWAKRYGIEIFTHPCSDCGRLATPSIPFAQGQLRGLQAPPCRTCGNVRTPFGMVRDPKHGDLFGPR